MLYPFTLKLELAVDTVASIVIVPEPLVTVMLEPAVSVPRIGASPVLPIGI